MNQVARSSVIGLLLCLLLGSCNEPTPPRLPEKPWALADRVDFSVLDAGVDCFFPVGSGYRAFGLIDRKGNLITKGKIDVISEGANSTGMTFLPFVGQKNVLVTCGYRYLVLSEDGCQEFQGNNKLTGAINIGDSLFTTFDQDPRSRRKDQFGHVPTGVIDAKDRYDLVRANGFWPRSIMIEDRVFVTPNIGGTYDPRRKVRAGLADRDGNILVYPKFDRFQPFHDGLAAVRLDGKCGFIDRDGNYAIEPKYLGVTNFSNGMAWAKMEGSEQLFLIDREGNELKQLPKELRISNGVSYGFGNGLRSMRLKDGWPTGSILAEGYVDPFGKWQIGPYEIGNCGAFNEGIAVASFDFEWLGEGMFMGKTYIIDTEGKPVVDRPVPSGIGPHVVFKHGLAYSTQGLIGYINTQAEVVWRSNRSDKKYLTRETAPRIGAVKK